MRKRAWLALAGVFVGVHAMTLASGVRATEGGAATHDWVSVGVEGALEHFVDAASLARSGEVVRVVKRSVYREPQPMGDTPGLPLVRETVGVIEDDCQRVQHRAVSLQLIGIEGQVLWSSGEMKRVWESIEPGSGGRATLDFACARTAR
jgi:hypothetical protein